MTLASGKWSKIVSTELINNYGKQRRKRIEQNRREDKIKIYSARRK